MPLFVPLLRLVMLFLNIYESYKTLKPAPPSARNEGRPSQRALTQRKRDMKGCLAVWIIWSCLVIYEGFVESLISLFVPFYDEVKSLGLLFLILTRARGAEPIFLHLIRPLVKPYAPTIDMLLDVARMIGDITFAILDIPMQLAATCWRKSMFSAEGSDSETDGTRETAGRAAVAASASLKRAAGHGQRDQEPLLFPKKTSSDRRPSSHSRPGSGDSDRRPSQTYPRVDKVGQRANGSDHPDARQVWYPPPSSYSDEENAPDPASTISGLPAVEIDTGFLSSEAMRGQAVVDEWRQYPPFPSAYPPTPIVASSGLPNAGASSARVQPLSSSLMLSEILEDSAQQDFSRSLLPPRKPLNPGFVSGLSDEHHISGVQNIHLESMSVDSDSEEDEEEDEFNTTLQTPMPPLRATRSGIVPVIPMIREVSMASSVASHSTTLTTAGHGSLRTQSSSESLSSSALSVSDLSSVLGKKRPLPVDVIDAKSKVHAEGGSTGGSRPRSRLPPDRSTRRIRTNVPSRQSREQVRNEDLDEDPNTSSSTDDHDADSINDRKPAYPKRRKVILSPGRAVNAPRPVRARVARYATAPTKAQIPKPPKPPKAPAASFRVNSSRLQTRSNTRSAGSAAASDASLSSINEVPRNSRATRLKTKPAETVEPLQRV